MDNPHLQALIRELLQASEVLTQAVNTFGENSLQAQHAESRYIEKSELFRRECFWEQFCNAEPWAVECRIYDV